MQNLRDLRWLTLLLVILQQDKKRYRVYNTYTTKEKEKYYNYPTAGSYTDKIYQYPGIKFN